MLHEGVDLLLLRGRDDLGADVLEAGHGELDEQEHHYRHHDGGGVGLLAAKDVDEATREDIEHP